MSKDSISKTSMDEYPEITQADFDRAVFRKNLKPVENKQRITIMLDAGVINYFKAKAGKRGYQTLINESLKRIIAGDQIGQSNIEETFRRIIREELSGIKALKLNHTRLIIMFVHLLLPGKFDPACFRPN